METIQKENTQTRFVKYLLIGLGVFTLLLVSLSITQAASAKKSAPLLTQAPSAEANALQATSNLFAQSANVCGDNKDNDEDGKIDGNDPNCCGGSLDSEQTGDCSGAEICDDGSDRDGDGLTDSEDPMCVAANSYEWPTNTVPVEDDNDIDVRANDRSPPISEDDDQIGEGTDKASSSNVDMVGFKQELPNTASVTFSQTVLGSWDVQGNDAEFSGDAPVDPEEYGTIDTTVMLYDKDHSKIAEWELNGAAGYSSEDNNLRERAGWWKDYYLDTDSTEDDDNLTETQTISHTFSDVGGAVYMKVVNSTYSDDDLDRRKTRGSWQDTGRDDTTDVFVRTLDDNIALDGDTTCDASTCGWEARSCGGSAGGANCGENEMLKEKSVP